MVSYPRDCNSEEGVSFGCAQFSACYTEIIPIFKLGKKSSEVALPSGAESCFNINSLSFGRVGCSCARKAVSGRVLDMLHSTKGFQLPSVQTHPPLLHVLLEM